MLLFGVAAIFAAGFSPAKETTNKKKNVKLCHSLLAVFGKLQNFSCGKIMLKKEVDAKHKLAAHFPVCAYNLLFEVVRSYDWELLDFKDFFQFP